MLITSRLGAPRDEIAAEAGRAEASYLQAKKQVEELKTLVQVYQPHLPIKEAESDALQYFKGTIDNRKKRWDIFRSHISSRAKSQFTYLLSERSFRGRLLADHSRKLLDLQVRCEATQSRV